MKSLKHHPKLYFVNCGNGPHRNWADCRKYRFVSAGQSDPGQQPGFFSKQLEKLKVGDLAAIYFNRRGYVAIARVTAPAVRILDFKIDDQPVTADMFRADMFDNCNNLDSEWLVEMEWLRPPLHENNAKCYGIYAKPHVVCSLDNQPILRKELQKAFSINFRDYIPNYKD